MMTVDELMEMVRLARENRGPEGKHVAAAFPNLMKRQAMPFWRSSQIQDMGKTPQGESQ